MQRTFIERDRLLKERDRLLRRAARATGLAGAATALLCMLVPGGLAPDIRLGSVLIVLAMAGWLYLLGRTGAIRWVLMTVLSGMAVILLIGFGRPPEPRMNVVEESVIAAVAAGAMSSVAIVLAVSLSRLGTLGAVLGFTVASVVATTVTSNGTIVPLAL